MTPHTSRPPIFFDPKSERRYADVMRALGGTPIRLNCDQTVQFDPLMILGPNGSGKSKFLAGRVDSRDTGRADS